MRLEMLAKDTQSGEKNCPSVHDDLDGSEFFFVGPTVDSSHVENVLPGESIVRSKREVVSKRHELRIPTPRWFPR